MRLKTTFCTLNLVCFVMLACISFSDPSPYYQFIFSEFSRKRTVYVETINKKNLLFVGKLLRFSLFINIFLIPASNSHDEASRFVRVFLFVFLDFLRTVRNHCFKRFLNLNFMKGRRIKNVAREVKENRRKQHKKASNFLT